MSNHYNVRSILIRFFLRFLRKLGWLTWLNLRISYDIFGTRFKIPIRPAGGLVHFFISENWMPILLKHLMEKHPTHGVFLDVGANVGQTLLSFKSLNLQEWSYIGFEPNPHSAAYVNDLIQINDFSNTRLIPAGIFKQTQVLDLYFNQGEETDTSASLVTDDKAKNALMSSKSVVIVDIGVIRSYLQNFQPVRVIKIDVEGAELQVLESLEPIVLRDQSEIICEVLPDYFGENKIRSERRLEIMKLLTRWDYVIHQVGLDGNVLALEEIPSHDDLNQTNYLFSPKTGSE